MTCKRPYCNETVLSWLDPDYCGTGCRAAAINAREQQFLGLKAELGRVEQLADGPAEGATVKALDTGETLQYRNGQWASGVLANQADVVWADTRTLAASATEDLDLADEWRP